MMEGRLFQTWNPYAQLHKGKKACKSISTRKHVHFFANVFIFDVIFAWRRQ
ncbi:hypothetical protein KP509_27G017300 [Ceratopteris richardii]|nr:hypothetical protein KP509_27G017300 [Ceratopteris richardii]